MRVADNVIVVLRNGNALCRDECTLISTRSSKIIGPASSACGSSGRSRSTKEHVLKVSCVMY